MLACFLCRTIIIQNLMRSQDDVDRPYLFPMGGLFLIVREAAMTPLFFNLTHHYMAYL